MRDYPSAATDVGWYIEMTREVDTNRGTVSVKSVKRLSEMAASCALPKKGGA